MLRSTLLLLWLLICSVNLNAQTEELDGPYVSYSGHRVLVEWAFTEQKARGGIYWEEGGDNQLPEFDGFHLSSFRPAHTFVRSPKIKFSGVSRVAALSDIHGQFPVARKLLIAHGIMDEEENWTFGDGHLVIVGDVFDRGEFVTPTLWLIHHLEFQAAQAGGHVHFLLGNHETMVMEGDIRYVNKRYMTTSGLLRKPYRELFGRKSYLGRWLRSLPLSVKINDVVYVHGGFSKSVLKEIGGLAEINDTYHKYLMTQSASLSAMDNPDLKLLHGEKGPLWYRGYFQDRDFTHRDIDKILKKLEAKHLVVGHTSFNAIKRYFGDRVFAVDSSIKFGSIGEILLIRDGEFCRGTLSGEVLGIDVMKK